jgi:hypothetical protein
MLYIRTLFFGNLKKMENWKRFHSMAEVEQLVVLSNPFEEWYGQSRVYMQFQFPVNFQEFKARLKSCWSVGWPVPTTQNTPDWSQVHSAASNADFSGSVMRTLIANDMARLGWSEHPLVSDWGTLWNPTSSWTTLNELFPAAPRTHGPGHRFVNPMLAEVVVVSLGASLDANAKKFLGFDRSFDRIFVEHLLGRLSIYMKEGWVEDNDAGLHNLGKPKGRKRKLVERSD